MARSVEDKKISGQSTIEFALTLLLLIGFTFFYLQLSLVFAFGNYVHYATFMAARAYLSASVDQDSQKQRARDVIIRTLKKGVAQAGTDRFPFMGKGLGGNDFPTGLQFNAPQYQAGDRNLSWPQGVRYTFRSRLFYFPLMRGGSASNGGNGGNPINSLTLTSESWLLREPTYVECEKQMGQYLGNYDNGC